MLCTARPARDRVPETNGAYHDAIADRYEKRWEGYSPDVRNWVTGLFEREIFPSLDASGGRPKVIDLGCGSGYLEDFLVERDVELRGLDVSTGMLERARAH